MESPCRVLTPEEIVRLTIRENTDQSEFLVPLIVRVVLMIGILGSLGMVAILLGLAVALWRWALHL